MKKTFLMLAFVAASSMVALAHGDDKKGSCCSKDAKKEASAKKDACCSKDSKDAKKSAKSDKKATKTETASKN